MWITSGSIEDGVDRKFS